MDEHIIRQTFARRLAFFRKSAGLTQSQLAEQIGYSDKAVSKWERAEGVPDIYTMSAIAELFGVNVDELINERAPERPANKEYNRRMIALVSAGLVWVLAALAFAVLSFLKVEGFAPWLCFIYGMPVSFVIWIVFSSVWWGKKALSVSISGLMWSTFLSFVMTFGIELFKSFFMAVLLFQIILILFFMIRFSKRKKGTVPKEKKSKG